MKGLLRRKGVLVLLTSLSILFTACASGTGLPDSEIEAQVRSALDLAADVPGPQLNVEVRNGLVTLTGSTACADCGGQATPGGDGTVEQSIGAVVRAVPGVVDVRFMTE